MLGRIVSLGTLNIMWKPKWTDTKIKAQEIASYYNEQVWNKERDSRQVVDELAKEHGMAVASIYRYLRSQGVKLPPRYS